MFAPQRPRRSALFLPASNARAIVKARSLDCDVVILDLEDAVAPELKNDARSAALAAVTDGGFGDREVAIRINALDSPWGVADLAAIADCPVDAVLIPKVNSAHDIQEYDAALSSAPTSVQLWAMIETCASVGALGNIASMADTTRLSLWIMGINDLAKEMRAPLLPDRQPFQPFLSMAVAAARVRGIAILDGVCNEIHDIDAFKNEARQGRLFGFDGKTLIHPAQIAPCNAVFSPTPSEIKEARDIIDAFAQPENQDKGAIRVNGRMAERMHLEDAERTMDLAGRTRISL